MPQPKKRTRAQKPLIEEANIVPTADIVGVQSFAPPPEAAQVQMPYLNFVRIPITGIRLDEATPVVFPKYQTLIDEALANYDFHSTAISKDFVILTFTRKND